MTGLIRDIQSLRCCSTAAYGFALGLCIALGLGSSPGRADPGDFGAMPGLWKIVITPIHQGHPGTLTIQWHCVDEGADPWIAFASFLMPDIPSCQRTDQHRSSTALAWALRCSGSPSVNGRGRVDFDSAEHYSAGVVLQDRGEVVRVEGRRYAACTSPSD